MNSGLSVFMIAKNAERDMAECLQSVRTAADEIVIVVDDASSDGTADAARKLTPNVFVRPFDGFSAMKSFALSHCTRPWALNLDTDERVSEELLSEISAVKSAASAGVAGYALNRLPYFLGRPVRHAGWFPDWVIRLVWRENAFYPERRVHERLEVRGTTARLNGLLHHYTVRDWGMFLAKQRRFAALSSEPRSMAAALSHAPAAFLKSAVLKLGVLDGWRGLAVAFAQGYYTFHKYAK